MRRLGFSKERAGGYRAFVHNSANPASIMPSGRSCSQDATTGRTADWNVRIQWDPVRQRVYASTITLPVAPEGTDELSPNEILEVVEPTDVNQVWVISRLSGSEDVISLRSSS